MNRSRLASLRVSLSVLAALVSLLSLPAAAGAQPSANVSIGRSFNSFNEGSPAESRQSVEGAIDAEHLAADGRLRLFYSLDAGTYTTPGDWAYYLNTAGASWRIGRPGEDGQPARTSFYLGGSAAWRSNGTSWAAADYFGASLFANVERRPSATSTLRVGYRFDARDFPDLSQLDQFENTGFASALVNLKSRTTLIGEVHVGAKNYRGGVLLTEVPVEVDPAAATTQMGRMGRGMGPSLRPSRVVAEQTPGEVSGQVTFLGRVAQSLTDRTGATLQYMRRTSFGGLPAAVVTTPALLFEDGIYDDPYASDADYLRASVKRVWGSGLEIEASGGWLGKDYRGMQALNLDGEVLATGELREDRIWRAGLASSVPLFPSRTGPVGLSLDVDYWYTSHESNDLYYNYRSHVVGVGVTVKY